MSLIPTIDVNLPVDGGMGLHGSMPMTISRQCVTCDQWTEGTCCKAFPGGIPQEILGGEADHRLPYAGDHGIRYTPIPGASGEGTEPLS